MDVTMPAEPHDERLKRLGREWFADVRAKNPEPTPSTKRRDGGDGADGGGGLLDWLFDGGSDDCGSDSVGD
jgi:hypothetical protein